MNVLGCVSFSFSEKISEANINLLKALNNFDVLRGFKFSIYASSMISRSIGRLATKAAKYRERFPQGDSSKFEGHLIGGKQERGYKSSLEALKEIVEGNCGGLSRVERIILNERFGFNNGEKKKTLNVIGKMVGLSCEGVRQVERKALLVLRERLKLVMM